VIRTLKRSDLPAVARLEAECDANTWTLEDYETLFEGTPGCGGFLCEIGGKPVGYLVHKPTECGRYVTGLGVLPWYRGQGLGRRLMRHLINLDQPLSLHVRVENKTARKLYRSLGFAKVRDEPDYYDEGQHGILLIRS
jgi:ribosomal protein S18 acetylase RimI-like enzyme